ncbi:hypothetical protein B0O99DRAFT_708813 [Bisporella sp. PMI_857]|nr:hypothetical protein B0O99DRAFT_708813 [Bisporella sp. PMI_857]
MSVGPHTLRRTSLPSSSISQCTTQQIRHASLLRRPHRPYTFTQLVTLSDGSTYLTRSTSPLPVYRSTKDTRNSALWQPSLSSLRNVEQDEAGRLRAFRQRFGRGWDMDALDGEEGGGKKEQEDSLIDLISGKAKAQATEEAETTERDGTEEMVTVKGADGKLIKVAALSRSQRRAAKK